jgi:predicted TIM-barrel fold metal-dependent hydrolase
MQAAPDHPLFLLLADIAARHQLPIDLHMEAVPEKMETPAGFRRLNRNNPPFLEPNIAALERLLAHNRKATIVWQHAGWDNTGQATPQLFRRLLKSHSNLVLALRIEERQLTVGGTPMANRIVDTKGAIRSEWLELLKDFPDRFMIGSDEFIGIPGRTPRRPQSFDETWPLLEQLGGRLAAKIAAKNARRVYGLQ